MIIFKPNGNLDVSTDPSDLPEQAQGNNIYSEAMQRCKNLRLDQKGVVKTRGGSSKINTTPLGQTTINKIIELAGNRYEFSGTEIYKNEASIKDTLTNSPWSAIVSSAYNSSTQNVFALNGTDRKKISDSSVKEWGIDPPTSSPDLVISPSETFTKLLLHCDGIDTSQAFTDDGVSVHAVTAVGDSQVDTADYKFASGAGLFDGNGDYLTIPDHADFDLSGGVWSFDCWIKPQDQGAYAPQVIYYQDKGSTADYIKLYLDGGDLQIPNHKLCFKIVKNSVTVLDMSTAARISYGLWQHIAVAENGGEYRLFISGTLRDSETGITARPDNYSSVVVIGAGAAAANPYKGAMDEIRLLKGTVGYWENFNARELIEYTDSIPGLTGVYNCKYTYCVKEGTTVVTESNPSPESMTPPTAASNYLTLTWAPSSDSQVTHVRLYRTIANGTDYYHDQDIPIGTTTITDWTPDAQLGSELEEDHDRPPLGTFVIGPNFNGYCFIIKDNKLHFSKPKQPEYWPTEYYLDISPAAFSGQCAVFWNGMLYYITKQEIYQIQGTSPETFAVLPMKATTGAQGVNGAVAVAGKGIFHVGSDGIYLLSGTDLKISQSGFGTIFRGETAGGMPGATSLANAILLQYRNILFCGYPGTGQTYPYNFLAMNLDTGRTSYYSWGQTFRALCVDEYNNRLLAGDASGYIWILEDSTKTKDGATDIPWEIETKNFGLQTQAHFPKYVKYDVDASRSIGAKGEVILEGDTHQNHILSEDRKTRKRLITPGNGMRCSFKISGSGPVEIYAIQSE
jgi:hypothetical protein